MRQKDDVIEIRCTRKWPYSARVETEKRNLQRNRDISGSVPVFYLSRFSHGSVPVFSRFSEKVMVLGSAKFKEQIGELCGRKVYNLDRRRPRKGLRSL